LIIEDFSIDLIYGADGALPTVETQKLNISNATPLKNLKRQAKDAK